MKMMLEARWGAGRGWSAILEEEDGHEVRVVG